MRELALALVPALGTTLLHFLWQGALIGALAALALQALRDAQPQARYTVACLALVACVLAPLATFIAQLVVLEPATADPAAAPVVVDSGGLAFVVRSSHETIGGMAAAMPWIVTAWASGALASGVRIAWGLAWIRSLKPAAPVALQVAWQRRLDAIARHFALGRTVELRLVDRLDTPAASGWLRPVVLLPTALVARMPVELVEALLAHELAHVRRHDYLVNLLQSAVEALLFYHPVTWWLSRRIRDEREQIADRLAAEVACPPRRLARALADLADFNAQPPLTELVLAAQGGQLMSRIQRLVRPAVPARPGAGLVLSLLGLVAVGAATFTYAQANPNADPASNFVTAGTPVARTAAAPVVAGRAAPVPAVAARAATSPVSATRAVITAQATTINVRAGTVVDHDEGDDDQTLALIDPKREGITMWGSLDDLAAIEAAKKQIRGEFLWVSRGEQAYVVTDATVIARAREAMRESEEHGRRMEVLGEEMEVHGRRMEALGARMEALSEQRETPEMKALEREMEALGRQQEALGRKQEALADDQPDEDEDPAKWRRYENEMEALSRQQDALGKQMDRLSSRLDATHDRLEAPMEALSREMDAASEPMEALGEKMEALGEEHEKLTEQSLREIRVVVDEAIARGLARPARVNVQID